MPKLHSSDRTGILKGCGDEAPCFFKPTQIVSHRLTLGVPQKMSHVVYIIRYQHVRNQFLDQLPFIAELLSDPMFHHVLFPKSMDRCCGPAPFWPGASSCSAHPVKFLPLATANKITFLVFVTCHNPLPNCFQRH